MEFGCVMCPEGTCSPDCPTLDVLPYREPVAEENIKKARKIVALGMDARYVKDMLKIAGGLKYKNQLIDMWLLEYESKEKDPLLVLIENRRELAQKQKLLDEKNKTLESLKAQFNNQLVSDPAPAPVVGEGLPSLRKCSTVLGGTSPKE